jgi:hypothetical protein
MVRRRTSVLKARENNTEAIRWAIDIVVPVVLLSRGQTLRLTEMVIRLLPFSTGL